MFLMLGRVRSIEGWGMGVYDIESGLGQEFGKGIIFRLAWVWGDVDGVFRERGAHCGYPVCTVLNMMLHFLSIFICHPLALQMVYPSLYMS